MGFCSHSASHVHMFTRGLNIVEGHIDTLAFAVGQAFAVEVVLHIP